MNQTQKIQNFRARRADWLKRNLDEETTKLCERNEIDIPLSAEAPADDGEWGDWRWQIRNHVTNLKELVKLFPEYGGQEAELTEWLKSYDLSILPLNLLQPNGVKKFLPRPGLVPAPDPYGVQREHSLILREQSGQKFYLATRKPGYATFLAILGGGADRLYCPMGCAGCYRGPQTRFNEPMRLIHSDNSAESISMPKPANQIRWLTELWNTDPRFSDVYDILISGGEPMILPNQIWARMLEELKNAKHLKSFRICTGALFLGLPFRFDKEFIGLLTAFRRETGVQIKISAHISHPENITPEAVLFARRLINAGLELLPQCPLETEVNFWPKNLERTELTLKELDRRLALAVGVRGYKWIIDMQRQSLHENISILSVIEIWRKLHDGHKGESDITRPTSLALFFPHERGNLNLSFYSLWAMRMEVDESRKIARYHIPHPAGGWLDYEEPLRKGVNDDPDRLLKLRGEI